MKKNIFFLLSTTLVVHAEEPTLPQENKASVLFGGYVKSEAFWDQRHVHGLRDDQFLFVPQNRLDDRCHTDINAAAQFDIVAFQTRLFTKITGPKIDGMDNFGFIEGDFFGVRENGVDSFRLRHAFFVLDAPVINVLLGQYYSPILVNECYPHTISFNTGAPFEPLTRNPQMRLTYNLGNNAKFIACFATEVENRSTGPEGANTKYLRNAQIPLIHGQIQKKFDESLLMGAGVDYRALTPRIETTKKFAVREHVGALSAIAYAVSKFSWLTIAAKFMYAANTFAYSQLSGYAITCVDKHTDYRSYAPLRSLIGWIDFETRTWDVPWGQLEAGLFVGLSKNIGTSCPLAPFHEIHGATSYEHLTFARNPDVDIHLRVSPRVSYRLPYIEFAAEVEISHAQYGTLNRFARPENTHPVTNTRVLLAGYHRF